MRRSAAFTALACTGFLSATTAISAAERDDPKASALLVSARQPVAVASEPALEADALQDGGVAQARLSIRISEGSWDPATRRMIRDVLHAVAEELVSRLPGRALAPIVVSHSTTTPVTLYDRGPRGEYFIQLTAAGDDPAAYAYEFAHELCHVLANYERHNASTRRHQWFEEALCEAASLYVLKTLATDWQRGAANPLFVAAAAEMRVAADRFFGEAHRHLPPGVSLAAWYRNSRALLARTPYDRHRNEVVANILLPLFEEHPWYWEAVGFLNLGQPPEGFDEYLRNWHDAAPPHCREVIRLVTAMFFEPAGAFASVSHRQPVDGASPRFETSAATPSARTPHGATGNRFTAAASGSRTRP